MKRQKPAAIFGIMDDYNIFSPAIAPAATLSTVIRAAEEACRIAAQPAAANGAGNVPTPATTVPNDDIATGTSPPATSATTGQTIAPVTLSEIVRMTCYECRAGVALTLVFRKLRSC